MVLLKSHHCNSSSHHDGRNGVFLIFGEETHYAFTDLLYKKLVDARISVCRNEEGALTGEKSENELLERIKPFRVSIPIISPDYLSEPYLKKLVQILECRKKYNQHVLPIFHKFEDVTKQVDVLEKEAQVGKRKRDGFEYGWIDALKKVLRLPGFQLENIADGNERELVEKIVDKVLKELENPTLAVSDPLIGVMGHVKSTNIINEEGSNDEPTHSPMQTSSQGGVKHDVFLSFRGTDTRKTFTSHLYEGLKKAGVGVYKDDREIPASADIHTSLMEAIANSTIAVPIFSTDYASSVSCLRELGMIYECRNKAGLTILPVFYHIEPSDVRHQRGSFEESFREHERKNRVCSQDLNHWKKALNDIGCQKGHMIMSNQNEAKIVKGIISDINKLLKTGEICVPKYLVGTDPPVRTIIDKLQVLSCDVRILGICGVSGIGKSTLAKVVYNKLLPIYEHHAFLEAQTEGPYTLQYQLISQLLAPEHMGRSIEENKSIIRNRFKGTKVLIVIDNVERSGDVKAFAGDLDFFGLGSRIIVTTKTTTLIKEINGLLHEMEPLNDADSRKLFCWYAFGRDFPLGKFNVLSKHIASFTGGIPSIIEAVGRCLSRETDEGTWKETLQKLKDAKHEKLDILSDFYEKYLDPSQKQIFLDIACFLHGKSKKIAHYMWEDCRFQPIGGVKKLLQLSLLKIGEEDELLMNNLLRNLGKKLVIKENPKQPAQRSRLWSHDDALKFLKGKKGTEMTEALCLNFDSSLTESLTNEAFKNLEGLRFLRLDKVKITGNFQDLLPELRWLDLKDCSDMLEELKDLSLEKLVILDISQSNIRGDWPYWESIMQKAEDLKVLVLASCQELQGSPVLTVSKKLKRLSFENCRKLRRVNTASDALKSLVSLNLKGCTEVNVLPKVSLQALQELIIDGTSVKEINARTLDMKKLEILSASGCDKLAKIDDSIGKLKRLSCLKLDKTAIKGLPASIGSLTNLQNLSLRDCKELHALPKSIGELRFLARMDLSDTAIKELPISIEYLKLLKVLLMGKTQLSEFPESITKLESLEKIDFSSCRQMKGRIPDGVINLSSLTNLLLSATAISVFPIDISGLSRLQVLDIGECKNLEGLPCLPRSLTTLHVGSCKLQRIPALSNVKELVELHLADNTENDRISEPLHADILQWIPHLPKLESLELRISKTTKLPHLSVLHKLRKLVLSCPLLESLPELPTQLTNLHLECCGFITQYENLSVLTLLSELKVDRCGGGCINLEKMRELRLLEVLCVGQKIKLCGIEKLRHLRKLTASNCLIQGDLSKLEKRGQLFMSDDLVEWKFPIREE